MDSNTTYPKILSLNPNELIDWCNNRKKEMKLSNAKLAELTGVPEGTLDRIFTGKNPEFRYSTIQPIVAYLIGIKEEVPQDETSSFYVNTIDGYKLIIENKNHIIDGLKSGYVHLQSQIDHLQKENEDKQKTIDKQFDHIVWMEKIIDESKKK